MDKIFEILMYNRRYSFSGKKLYSQCHFGFQQKYLITHFPIYLTGKIRLEIHKSIYVCGILVEIQTQRMSYLSKKAVCFIKWLLLKSF